MSINTDDLHLIELLDNRKRNLMQLVSVLVTSQVACMEIWPLILLLTLTSHTIHIQLTGICMSINGDLRVLRLDLKWLVKSLSSGRLKTQLTVLQSLKLFSYPSVPLFNCVILQYIVHFNYYLKLYLQCSYILQHNTQISIQEEGSIM